MPSNPAARPDQQDSHVHTWTCPLMLQFMRHPMHDKHCVLACMHARAQASTRDFPSHIPTTPTTTPSIMLFLVILALAVIVVVTMGCVIHHTTDMPLLLLSVMLANMTNNLTLHMPALRPHSCAWTIPTAPLVPPLFPSIRKIQHALHGPRSTKSQAVTTLRVPLPRTHSPFPTIPPHPCRLPHNPTHSFCRPHSTAPSHTHPLMHSTHIAILVRHLPTQTELLQDFQNPREDRIMLRIR